MSDLDLDDDLYELDDYDIVDDDEEQQKEVAAAAKADADAAAAAKAKADAEAAAKAKADAAAAANAKADAAAAAKAKAATEASGLAITVIAQQTKDKELIAAQNLEDTKRQEEEEARAQKVADKKIALEAKKEAELF